MCRNIKTLFNFDSPGDACRKSTPRRCNSCASFPDSIRRRRPIRKPSTARCPKSPIAPAALLASLHTNAPTRDREVEAEKGQGALADKVRDVMHLT